MAGIGVHDSGTGVHDQRNTQRIEQAQTCTYCGGIIPTEGQPTAPNSPWQKCNFLNWDSRVSAKTEQR